MPQNKVLAAPKGKGAVKARAKKRGAERRMAGGLGGFIFLDKGSATDETGTRKSTAVTAHSRFRMFTGRDDPAGRPEQYERLYIILVDANPEAPQYDVYRVGDPKNTIPLETAFNELLDLIAERNPDFYEVVGGKIETAS